MPAAAMPDGDAVHGVPGPSPSETAAPGLDALDRRIVQATQAGLPVTARPFHALAAQLGEDVERVKQRLVQLLDRGVIRRIAGVPNHYRLGYRANAMSVWDVDDRRVAELGPRVGALAFVSHCYQRPRVAGVWRYNLFAMLHGHDRDEVADRAARVESLLADACCAHELIYSVRILKKTGLRLPG